MLKTAGLHSKLKRTMDVCGAVIGLLLCAPLMLMIGIIVALKAGRPILYRENRIGLHQTPFMLYKFRTMKTAHQEQGATVASSDDTRILPYGHVLRESHLDELPQLWNVLKGDMSLIGPRPYKPSHFDRLSETSRQIITSVRPGLSGADSLTFIAEDEALRGLENPEAAYLDYILPEKVNHQIDYIENQSIRKDLLILLQTLKALVFGHTTGKSVNYLRSLFEQDHN